MSEQYQLLELERVDSKDSLIDIQQESNTVEQEQDQEAQEQMPTVYTVGTVSTKIYFKTVAGQRYDLLIAQPLDTMTVLQLKQLCNDQHSIPPDLQRLIFLGRELRNEEILTACRIENESVIHLLLQHQPVQLADPSLADASPQVRNAVQDASQLLDSVHLTAVRQKARNLLMFSIMDILFDFMRFLNEPLFILPTLAAVVGFWGIRNYSRSALIIYALGIVMQSVLFMVVGIQSNDNSNIIFSSIMVLIEFYVLYLVKTLVVLLQGCTEEQTRQLRSLNA